MMIDSQERDAPCYYKVGFFRFSSEVFEKLNKAKLNEAPMDLYSIRIVGKPGKGAIEITDIFPSKHDSDAYMRHTDEIKPLLLCQGKILGHLVWDADKMQPKLVMNTSASTYIAHINGNVKPCYQPADTLRSAPFIPG